MYGLLLAAVIRTFSIPDGIVQLHNVPNGCDTGNYVQLLGDGGKVVDTGCWWYAEDGVKVIVKWESIEPKIYYGDKRIPVKTIGLASVAALAALAAGGGSSEPDRPVSP